MAEFTVRDMQEMQKALQEKYRDKWEPIYHEIEQNKLLWMIEICKVVDIVKKNSGRKASEVKNIRRVDDYVLIYFNDVMMCYGITEDELKAAYTDKFKRNMKR